MPQSKSFRLLTNVDTYVYHLGSWTLGSTGQQITDERIVIRLNECRAATDGSFLDLRVLSGASPNIPKPAKGKAARSKKKKKKSPPTRSSGGKP